VVEPALSVSEVDGIVESRFRRETADTRYEKQRNPQILL